MTVDLRIDMTMLDDDFFEELDEIIEDTMIHIFMLHPKDMIEIERAKMLCKNYPELFYAIPFESIENKDDNCKAVTLNKPLSLSSLNEITLPIFINSELIDESFYTNLASSQTKGVILHASKNYALPNYFDGMTRKKVLTLSPEVLEAIDMTNIVLHSNYPHQSFESIDETAKIISDAIFRPDESIKNHATRNSLALLGLR